MNVPDVSFSLCLSFDVVTVTIHVIAAGSVTVTVTVTVTAICTIFVAIIPADAVDVASGAVLSVPQTGLRRSAARPL